MAGRRRWLSAIVVAAAGLLGAIIPVFGQSASENTADFQILAVKPERLGKSYKLIPVGESEFDQSAYEAVLRSLPQSMFGGIVLPDYDDRAEQSQCRAACVANKACTNFSYVRRAKDRPLGVCHLRRTAERPAVTALPLPPPVEAPAVAPPDAREPDAVVDLAEVAGKAAPAKITIGGKAKTGHVSYLEADAPETPATFRFDAPVSGAVATVRARDIPGTRAWVVLDVLDADGKRLERTGAWVANDDQQQKISVKSKGEKIAAIRVTARGASVLIVDRLDFERGPVAAAETMATAPAAKGQPAPAVEEVAEADPLPPVPEADAIDGALPLPPRAVATDAPANIAQPVAAVEAISETAGTVVQAEAPATPETSTAAPIAAPAAPVDAPVAAAPKADAPASSTSAQDELPLLAAVGALVFLLGGAGVYHVNYRARTLKRLSTSLVSDGMDRHTVGIEAEQPDMSLRFAVRSPASIGARHTMITIVPDGVAA